MITTEFKGRKLCNSLAAVVIYYPKLTNGGDILMDARKEDQVFKWASNCYVAFRMAADSEARKKNPEEIMNELGIDDFLENDSELVKLITYLIGEKKEPSEAQMDVKAENASE